jgi:UDP-N-acetylmuramyl pentapeptide phosphotransferase/UDP-N-acetylglucosamine-1-phosphate transferase
MILILAFAIPFLIVLLLMPVFSKLAIRYDFTDKPTERKKHAVPMPLSGGLVMFIGFTAGFFIVFFISGDTQLYVVPLGCAMIVGIGLVDDYFKTHGKEFPVWPRIIVYIAAALLAFMSDIRFTGFHNPISDLYILFPVWLQFILTVLWFVGLTTVFNFMDGLDGLAGGLAMLSGFTLFVVALVKAQPDSAMMALLLLGAVIGFLRYNFPPARVIMGDSGAYLLGYLLAAISLFGAFKQATIISVLIPIIAMGVPIFDSLLVTFRRLRAGKPVHGADSTHITHLHYRLLKTGMKPTHAVALIVLLSACLNLTSIIILLIF